MSNAGEDDFRIRIERSKSPRSSRGGRPRAKSFYSSVAPKRGGGRGRPNRSQRSTSQRTFHRRVVVQASIKKIAGFGAAKLKDHLKYLERDATQKDASPGKLYGSLIHDVDAESFQTRCKDDRHHFRFIVSPEDAEKMSDLTGFTRELVSRMESDLGTKLDWVAVDHYDTAQPHTHLTVRGVRDDGKDLVIPRKYISHGMRERAQALASLELGPVTELERRSKMARTITAERMTDLDKTIDQMRDGDIVNLAQPAEQKNLWRKQLIRKRMETLRKMGLAEYEGKALWRMSPKWTATLTRMGEQNDILKTLHRAMAKQGMEQTLGPDAIFDPADIHGQPVTGIVKSYGRRDDRQEKGFVVIESLQGRVVFAAVSENEAFSSLKTGQVVTFGIHSQGPRAIDKSIAAIAQDQAGIYSPMHHQLERNESEAYVKSHVRRLEALRRSNVVIRNQDGSWRIPEDYLERVNDYEAERAKRLPTPLQRNNKITLQQMETARGATWLDRALVEEKLMGLPEENPVRASAAKRLEVLKGSGFEIGKDGKLPSDTLSRLKDMDLKEAGENLSKSLSKPYVTAQDYGRIDGTYVQTIDRPSGKFAIIERSREFTLVPWRPVMERRLGQSISGTIGGSGISWDVTGRRGPSR